MTAGETATLRLISPYPSHTSLITADRGFFCEQRDKNSQKRKPFDYKPVAFRFRTGAGVGVGVGVLSGCCLLQFSLTLTLGGPDPSPIKSQTASPSDSGLSCY